MEEKWLPVVGFENFYQISDQGRVYSVRSDKIMRPSVSNSGSYPMYNFCVKKKQTGKLAHRLVLEAFDCSCPPGQEARHLDGDSGNPALYDIEGKKRLAWGTSSDNKYDEVRHGTHPQASRDHCDNGHEFTEKNTRIQFHPDGTFKQRACKECGRLAAAARRKLRESDERRCKEEGCDKPYFGRDWCSSHYDQWYRQQPGVLEKAAERQRRYLERKQAS